MASKTLYRTICPYLNMPCDDCYCNDMSKPASRALATYFCTRNFKKCKIYLKIESRSIYRKLCADRKDESGWR